MENFKHGDCCITWEISKVNHYEKFDRSEPASLSEHRSILVHLYFSETQRGQSKHPGCLLHLGKVGFVPPVVSFPSFLSSLSAFFHHVNLICFLTWCRALIYVGRILISRTETERPTPAAVLVASLPIIVGLTWWESKMFTSVGELSCHRQFHHSTHYMGFLVRFLTDFCFIRSCRFNSNTCVNCWWLVWSRIYDSHITDHELQRWSNINTDL